MADTPDTDGDGTESGDADETLAPTAAFSLLANEKRFEILATLAEAPYEEFEGVLSFSELWHRTSIQDSGQFNYHLEKLVGSFVRHTEAGYRLRHAGRMLYRIAVSELVTGRGSFGPVPVGSQCSECGGELAGVHDDEFFSIECQSCGSVESSGEFPRSALAHYEPERLPYVFNQQLRSVLYRVTDDVCHWCAGPLDTRIEQDGAVPSTTGWTVYRRCDHCGALVWTGLGTAALFHPAVVSFYHDHGVNLLRHPTWDLDLVPEPPSVEVETDPWRATLRLERDGDSLEITLDESASVRDVTRNRE